MKHFLLLSSIVLGCIFLSSCDRFRAKNCASEFCKSVKDGDENKMAELYPSISLLPSYKKSDESSISDITSIGDNKYKVTIDNKFTNSYGKKFENTYDLYVRKTDEGKFVIYDSKGLCDFADEEGHIYEFCKNTGCISGKGTDVATAKRIKAGYLLAAILSRSLIDRLKSDVRVSSWSWSSSDYSDSASGKGIVYNGSQMTVSNLKYEVTYKNSYGEELTTDDGYVSYGDIESGESVSFTFYTSYVPSNASKASIELVFDEEGIIEQILEFPYYTGTEYNDHKSELN